jgi:hypothetical protein
VEPWSICPSPESRCRRHLPPAFDQVPILLCYRSALGAVCAAQRFYAERVLIIPDDQSQEPTLKEGPRPFDGDLNRDALALGGLLGDAAKERIDDQNNIPHVLIHDHLHLLVVAATGKNQPPF